MSIPRKGDCDLWQANKNDIDNDHDNSNIRAINIAVWQPVQANKNDIDNDHYN